MANLALPLLFIVAATPFAAANSHPADSSNSFGNVDPSIAVIVVVLVLAFFLMGFISICIRHRVESTSYSDDSRRFVVATSLWRASHGLDPSVIESFPVFSYSEVKDRWIGNGGSSLECAVCINEFVDGEMLRKLPKCNHVFHPGCIDAWLASHTSCPVCRKDQSPEPDGSIDYKRMEPDNSRSEAPGLRNQVSITVNSDENVTEMSRIVNKEVKTKKISRSNSTGHSLVQPAAGESTERYILNFPEEIRVQVAANSSRLKRTKSCDVILPVVNGDRSGDVERSKRWTFNVAHRCLFRTGSIQDADSGSKTLSRGTPV